jgi:hypothetical protein
VASKVELDPLGVKVDDQWTQYSSGTTFNYNPTGFYGTPRLPDMGCTSDGVVASCDDVARGIGQGLYSHVTVSGIDWGPMPGHANQRALHLSLLSRIVPTTTTHTLRLQNGRTVETHAPGGQPGFSAGGYSSNFAVWTTTQYMLLPGFPQNFNLGNTFSQKEVNQLQQAYKKILDPNCVKWFNAKLKSFTDAAEQAYFEGGKYKPASYGRAKDLPTLVNNFTTLVRYNSPSDVVGLSQAGRQELEKGGFNAFTRGSFIYLPSDAFINNSLIAPKSRDRDLAGIIIHELFHVAGVGLRPDADVINALDQEIKDNCSHTSGQI